MNFPERDFYMRINYEVNSYYNDELSNTRNIMARVRNALIFAMNKEWFLPKLIVVVLEEDIIKYVTKNSYTDEKSMSMCITHIVNDFRKAIASFKDVLPSKSKRHNWPHVLWILPVQHVLFKNFVVRQRFSRQFEKIVAMQHNMSALKLRQVWDEHDTSLYLPDYNRFTSLGYKTYWAAVDCTVKYCDKMAFMDNSEQTAETPKRKQYNSNEKHRTSYKKSRYEYERPYHFDRNRNDRYHWKSENYYKLPEPPARR